MQLPTRRRVYLMRHGDVSYFDNGQPVPPESVSLNDTGRAQAQAAAHALADVAFDRVICSGLERTVQTAEIVVGSRDLPVLVEPALHEIRPGKLADIAHDELLSTFTQALTRPITPDDRFVMGETYGELQTRVLPAFRAIVADRSWQRLLIVAHGAVNRTILAEVMGVGLEVFGHMEQDAACINVFDLDERGYGIIRLLNYTPYSPIKTGIELTTMERYFLEYQP
ncbi:MAG TPA: histidine phosphatase family protein, partial [Roseiflexaceae bacterium]|nr:histidine phosphatase family protein [Roseiflexaceae bacterium]